MGGICAKPYAIGDASESSSSREKASESLSKRGERFRAKSRVELITTGSIDKRLNSSRFDRYEKKKEEFIAYNIPKAIQGEQIVAGWPSWLAAVAGEAINGWLPRRADTFEKLDKIGQGTYSSVYKARDLTNNKIVALKRVRFDKMDSESVKFMAREIVILRRLDHPNIIKLEGLVTSRSTCSLYLVFEYMEHDLTGLASLPGVKFTEPQVKCYMQQLLCGLDYCHSHGVLHRDIKGSNLLIDDKGILKIADFGLASFFDNNKNVPLTSRVVTLWYRPPELLLGETHYGVAVDLWSTGCILGELYAGKPIMSGRTEVEQLHKIFKLCGSPSEDYWRKLKLRAAVFKPTQPYKRRIEETFKDIPSVAVGLMETLLAIDPSQRGTALFALKSEFFTTKPHACDPSSLPNYPPSKEMDAKLREEEARRQRAEGGKALKIDKQSRGPRVVPVPDANTEYVASMQRRHDRANSNSRSGYFKRNEDDTASGERIVQRKMSNYSKEVNNNELETRPPMRESYSESLVARTSAKSEKNYDDISIINRAEDSDIPQFKSTNQMGRLSSTKEPVMNNHGYKGNKKIHFSGPLGASNVDQILKDHDRHIQQAVRRARLDKTRLTKLEPHAIKNMLYTSSHRVR